MKVLLDKDQQLKQRKELEEGSNIGNSTLNSIAC